MLKILWNCKKSKMWWILGGPGSVIYKVFNKRDIGTWADKSKGVVTPATNIKMGIASNTVPEN